ncbi:plasmid pRiA4b ORF-3 family protein [Bacillus carboniphilus]|uniref:Plasmid pRiA4b ORF-3 family protein n=1 Tax=Bacillus carboniphilus TaxID=86663 RepID=A0ABY9JS28_9BACI|nr:plasmid pRiA4b ORF-3 family protein [Bacillus carboniphilus]WLR41543.1 plasmid pRiA4b ORF-3 family protein [Bacillus carboniphilus]
MRIQCTKKLLDELNVPVAVKEEEDPFYSWHANLIKLGRKKTVVLVNDLTRYMVVLFGLKAKDIREIETLIPRAIQETFQAENIKEEVIEQYIQNAGSIIFSKTKDRTYVARMNKSGEEVYYFEDLINEEQMIQSELGFRVSKLLVGNGKNAYIYPNKEIYKQLEEMANQAIFYSEAIELKVTLLLENHSVWRKFVVPSNITFSRLHKTLQVCFGWRDSHLHDYLLYPDKDVAEPILNIVSNEEAFDYQGNTPMKKEEGLKLIDFLPSKIVYNYDFGDNWQHVIEVVKTIEDYDVNYPKCLDGEGNSPPEDVGGEPGYEDFLKIIEDKDHPEHDEMVNWGKMQGYKEFDLNQINGMLKI